MAEKNGKSKGRSTFPRFFFLSGKLYKRLSINRSADTIEVWCYPEERRVVLTYSEVRKKYEPAFSTREVGELLGRNSRMVERYARWGKIPPVAVAHGLKGNRPQFDPLKWCEQDIMYLHDYLLTLQRGKPRADGRVIPNPPLPTKKELRALIRHETVLYVLNADGEFVPTWKA